MSIVLPIVFFAVGLGLFVTKMTARLWALLTVWIGLVITVAYLKG
jgi:hypothetical protein